MFDDYLTDADNMDRLAEMHCTSSGLKALVTQLVCDGMETCRQACGGHAFLTTAGFQELLTSYLPFKTLEGTREVWWTVISFLLLLQPSALIPTHPLILALTLTLLLLLLLILPLPPTLPLTLPLFGRPIVL
jgi:hypothetical protein